MDDHVIGRYRNITALVLVIGGQLLLLAWQVKQGQELTPVRAWAIAGFMPMARALEFVRDHTIGLAERYAGLMRAQTENGRLAAEVDRLKLENQFLKNELSTADRAHALALFQAAAPYRTLAGRVVGVSTVPGSRVLFIDRGLNDGVRKAMAVITPDGLVGRIATVLPANAQAMLITDMNFSAGVVSDKGRVMGIAKGQGHASVLVEYIQNEDEVQEGETFQTSGDDGIFPMGVPVGRVKVSRKGRGLFREIFVEPAGLARGLETVLILLDGSPSSAPFATPPAESSRAAPSGENTSPSEGTVRRLPIDADRILNKYERIGQAQGHRLGAGAAPDFTVEPPPLPAAAAPPPPKAKP